LSYGRVEDGGLRCLYHGWLYDIHGRCLEQPGEPGGGVNCAQIKHLSYPCQENAGVVFAYMGPGDAPLFPAYEIFTVPDENRKLPMKTYHECNYLQANEGNLDPAHLSFLHRISKNAEMRSANSSGTGMVRAKAHELNLRDLAPSIDVELTDYGLRIYSVRKTSPEENYVRITNFIMPNLCAVGGGTGGDGYQMDWHVPIDDTHHWKYTFAYRRSGAVPERQLTERRAALGEGYKRLRNASNRYLQDREEMRGKTFTGLGTNFLDHDAWAVESQGPVQDRANEHLSASDRGIVAERKLLLQAIRDVEAGRDPQHVVRDANANRFPHLFVRHEVVPSAADWKNYWKAGL
jgi:phenylpropionate dioxygenase-like ring-hydroxylating dioxygenase large terminal subunit